MKSECSWLEAREICESTFKSLQFEKISINQAVDRILFENVLALTVVPAYRTSAMDGWVVSGSGPWKIIGEVITGTKESTQLKSGETMRIATGGVLPDGGEAVIPWEKTVEKDGLITGDSKIGENIREAGAECNIGDLLLGAGEKINPFHLGLFAASGVDEVKVVVKPKVSIFILGDELLEQGIPKDGQIRDALGIQLPSFLLNYGVEITKTYFVKDDLNTLINLFDKEIISSEIIITTGGTADGPRDFVKPMIEKFNGKFLIDRVKVRPGYHILINTVLNKSGKTIIVISLPGNPLSAISSLTSFGIPLIYSLLGRKKEKEIFIKLGVEITTPTGFSRQIPGNVIDGEFIPAKFLGSAMLRGLANSSGFAILPPGLNEKGTLVRWLAC
jgi:molybdopterin molybdotransferase